MNSEAGTDSGLFKIQIAVVVLAVLIIVNSAAILTLALRANSVSEDAAGAADTAQKTAKNVKRIADTNREQTCAAYPSRQKELVLTLQLLSLSPQTTPLEQLYRDDTLPGLLERAKALGCPLPPYKPPQVSP